MCDCIHMPSNLAINDRLLAQALRLGGRRTKRETVNEALQEYIQRRQQQKVLRLFGTVSDLNGYDPKKNRRRA